MDTDINVSFKIYNTESVKRLQEEDPDILPTYTVAESKDLVYNKKQINNSVTSAIIQGKSVDGIAADLQSRMESLNRNSAVKVARTGITNAQNAGTLSRMKELAAMGVEVQKEWVATLDDRTRKSHRKLDGEKRDLDERFSNGLMYPGASGSSKETWNCRCRMVSFLPDVDTSDAVRWSKNPETGRREYAANITYEEWYKSKTKPAKLTGAIYGALNDENDPDGRKRSEHAKSYYESVRNSKKEYVVRAISENTDFPEKEVSNVYDHVFINEYELDGGKRRFDEDYYMAESFRRLREGKDIQEHDIILLKHEALEYKLMSQGLTYDEAHRQAERLYNYKVALDEHLKER